MDMTVASSYQPPVDRLLTYGEASGKQPKDWPDYLALGLTSEHVPELIRMATDRELNLAYSDGLEVWAPLHAWRTLGQLRAVEAVKPLFRLYDMQNDDDWMVDDLPRVFDLIGPPALPILEAHLADHTQDEEGRINVATGIANIGEHWPDMRSTCVAILMAQLERTTKNETDLSAFLILDLVQMKATEAAPIMERAFADGRVDLMLMGDWDDVQAELGLLSDEELAEHNAKRARPASLPFSMPITSLTTTPVPLPASRSPKGTSKKSKDKMAKQSRKKNRKR